MKKRRGVPKRRLTNLEKWFNDNGNRADVFLIDAKLEDLEEAISSFKDLQTQLELLDPDECDRLDSDEFVSRATVMKGNLKRVRADRGGEPSFNETGGGNSSTIIVDAYHDTSNIELDVFDGDYIQFPSFIDTFYALVHNNTNRTMTDLRRFNILKNHLGPNVMRSMQHYRMTSANYYTFLSALENRYGRPRMVFGKFISDLNNLPQAKDTAGLRTLSDGVVGIIKSLEAMATSEQIKEGLLIHLIRGKCDGETISRWEDKVAQSNELPKWDDFIKFLENRCTTLECSKYAETLVTSTPAKPLPASTPGVCKICTKKCANPESCSLFISWDPHQRHNRIKQLQICMKCLGDLPHEGLICKQSCSICQKPHHTLLHFPVKNTNLSQLDRSTTLLATALVSIKGGDGKYYSYRALLDSGSQISFISQRAYKQLALRAENVNLSVSGIHGHAKVYKKEVVLDLKSKTTEYQVKVPALINNRLDGCYPSSQIDIGDWNIPNHCELADPNFNIPRKVDIILSADVFYKTFSVGQVQMGPNKPWLHKTTLGWVAAGNVALPLSKLTPSNSLLASAVLVPELDWLKRFWEQEDLKRDNKLSQEEEHCERYFVQTVKRAENGRFIVRLPFKQAPEMLGDSRKIATSR